MYNNKTEEDMSDDQIVRLISDDGTTFDVRRDVIRLSGFVSMLLPQDDTDNEEIPVPGVAPIYITKVIEFCEHYKDAPMNEIEKPLASTNMHEVVEEWYANFVNVDQEMLFSLINAANLMNVQPLLDLSSATVASLIKDRSAEEIRQIFNITNDFTPEEEAQIREENKWADEA